MKNPARMGLVASLFLLLSACGSQQRTLHLRDPKTLQKPAGSSAADNLATLSASAAAGTYLNNLDGQQATDILIEKPILSKILSQAKLNCPQGSVCPDAIGVVVSLIDQKTVRQCVATLINADQVLVPRTCLPTVLDDKACSSSVGFRFRNKVGYLSRGCKSVVYQSADPNAGTDEEAQRTSENFAVMNLSQSVTGIDFKKVTREGFKEDSEYSIWTLKVQKAESGQVNFGGSIVEQKGCKAIMNTHYAFGNEDSPTIALFGSECSLQDELIGGPVLSEYGSMVGLVHRSIPKASDFLNKSGAKLDGPVLVPLLVSQFKCAGESDALTKALGKRSETCKSAPSPAAAKRDQRSAQIKKTISEALKGIKSNSKIFFKYLMSQKTVEKIVTYIFEPTPVCVLDSASSKTTDSLPIFIYPMKENLDVYGRLKFDTQNVSNLNMEFILDPDQIESSEEGLIFKVSGQDKYELYKDLPEIGAVVSTLKEPFCTKEQEARMAKEQYTLAEKNEYESVNK